MADSVLVCVTGQSSSQRLIRKGADIAQGVNAPLLVLSVSGDELNHPENPQVRQALNDLYRLSGEVGAEMTMLQDADAHRAICGFARRRGVGHIVLGEEKPGQSAFAAHLMRSLPKVAFTIEPAQHFVE